MSFEPYDGRTFRAGFDLRKMVIGKLAAIVCLNALERKSWGEELGGMFKEVYGCLRVPAWIDTFVLNARGAIDDVILVTTALPVLHIHLPYLTWSIYPITASIDGFHFLTQP